MAGVYELNHKGKTILCLDIAGLQKQDKWEFLKHVRDAEEKIRLHSPRSILIITNVSNTGFDSEMANRMKEYANHNTPYIRASALVGISGLQKIIYTAIKTFTGRDFFLAETQEEALNWLVKQ
jgi:hypothetical protein